MIPGMKLHADPDQQDGVPAATGPNSPSNVNSTAAPLNSDSGGHSYERPHRTLIPGVYVPTVCFFNPTTEEIDVSAITAHAARLAAAGVNGLVTQGSNGEAVHLTHAERSLVTSTTRAALDAAGYESTPVIAGCGAQSTRETIILCREACESGADYALVLPPSYYAPLTTSLEPRGVESRVLRYFTEVADASPIPLIIYNYPGGAGGVDLSSDVIVELARHPRIVGVKLTCGNTGKLNRIAATTRSKRTSRTATSQENSETDSDLDPSSGVKRKEIETPDFIVLAGSADFMIQSLVAGGHGILAGLANLAPRSCVRGFDLYQDCCTLETAGGRGRAGEKTFLLNQTEDTKQAQEIISRGDWVAIQGGVVGVKSGMQSWLGYGGYARSPLPRPTAEQARIWEEGYRELMDFEAKWSKEE